MAIATVHQNSSMTSSSMMKNTSDVSVAESATDQTIQKMKANIVRYARNNDKRMVLRSLMDVKMLNCLSLDVAQPSDGPLFDLEKEVAEENVNLNGVEFRAVSTNSNPALKDGATSGINNSCVPMLKGLCREFCDRKHVEASSREVYEKLIVRLAKTTSSADPYFRLNSLLGSPDLLVMPFDGASLKSRPASNKPQEQELPPPAELNIYESNGEIHASLQQTYKFGLLRKSDVKSNRPWIVVDGVVRERANLSTNSSVRELKVVLPEIYS